MAIATSIMNIPAGNPQNPGSGNTATGESGMAFDTTLDAIKVFDGTTLHTIESGKTQTEVVTATNIITAEESGKTFFLNSATEFVSTLPVPAAGLNFTFYVTAAPSGASYTVVTAGVTTGGNACEIMIGHVLTSGFADSGSDVELTAGGTTLTFVNSVSAIGDRAYFISDGTNWYVSAITAVEAGITITG